MKGQETCVERVNPMHPPLQKSLSVDTCSSDYLYLFVRTGSPRGEKCSAALYNSVMRHCTIA